MSASLSLGAAIGGVLLVTVPLVNLAVHAGFSLFGL
jgi:hypothetical protein